MFEKKSVQLFGRKSLIYYYSATSFKNLDAAFVAWKEHANEPLPTRYSDEKNIPVQCNVVGNISEYTELSVKTRFAIDNFDNENVLFTVFWQSTKKQFKFPVGTYVFGFLPGHMCEPCTSIDDESRFFELRCVGWSFALENAAAPVIVPRPKVIASSAPLPPLTCHASFYEVDNFPDMEIPFTEDELFGNLIARDELYYQRYLADLNTTTERIRDMRQKYPDEINDHIQHWYMFLYAMKRRDTGVYSYVETHEQSLFSFRIRKMHALTEMIAWSKRQCPFIDYNMTYVPGGRTDENNAMRAALELFHNASILRVPFQYAARILDTSSIVRKGYVYTPSTNLCEILVQHFNESYANKKALYATIIEQLPINPKVERVFARLDEAFKDKFRASANHNVPDIEDIATFGPPCIQAIHRKLFDERLHLIDSERFLHTSFLLRLGFEGTEILKMWEPTFAASDKAHAQNWRGHVSVMKTRSAKKNGLNCTTIVSKFSDACPFASKKDAELQRYLVASHLSEEDAESVTWVGRWFRRPDLLTSIGAFGQMFHLTDAQQKTLLYLLSPHPEREIADFLAGINEKSQVKIQQAYRGESVATSISVMDIGRCMRLVGVPEIAIMGMLGECDDDQIRVPCLQCKITTRKKHGVSADFYSPAQAFAKSYAASKATGRQISAMPADWKDDV